MNCNGFKKHLHDYCTGDLPLDLRGALERHGERCAGCGELMRTAQELTCKELTEFLNDYIDEVLSPERRAVFERHIAICPDCQAYLQSYRRTMEMAALSMKRAVAGLPDNLPPDLIRAILAARSQ